MRLIGLGLVSPRSCAEAAKASSANQVFPDTFGIANGTLAQQDPPSVARRSGLMHHVRIRTRRTRLNLLPAVALRQSVHVIDLKSLSFGIGLAFPRGATLIRAIHSRDSLSRYPIVVVPLLPKSSSSSQFGHMKLVARKYNLGICGSLKSGPPCTVFRF